MTADCAMAAMALLAFFVLLTLVAQGLYWVLFGLPKEEDHMTCPWCRSPKSLMRLGVLGRRTWYRCRQCGGDSSKLKGGK